MHAVTSDRVLALPDFSTRAATLGADERIAVHLRARDRTARDRLRLMGTLPTAGTVIVNDRVDLAVAGRAAGVHLPSFGLPIGVTRAIAGPALLIGRSAHTADEALAADAEGADYVFLGPIWQTASHPGSPGIGVSAIERSRPARVIAIGGVTPDRVRACLDAGAWGVAAISALWLVDDVAAAAEAFLLSLGR